MKSKVSASCIVKSKQEGNARSSNRWVYVGATPLIPSVCTCAFISSYILKKLIPTTINFLNMHTLHLIMHVTSPPLTYFSQHASMTLHHPTCIRKTQHNMPLCIIKTHMQHACM